MTFGSIIKLTSADLPDLENLLRLHQLPADDCVEQGQNFSGIFDGSRLIAAGGLEPAGAYALLRSVVVDRQFRYRGLAKSITETLIRQANGDGRKSVYLLTETAADYFKQFGFTLVERCEVPNTICQTRQFATLCPDTAHCMVLTLDLITTG